MWAVFTYIYNSILIIFIAIHLLVGALITFCVGVYIGIYLSQNYQIPRIDEPFKLWSYFVKFLEQRRKPGGMSIFPSINKNEDKEGDKKVQDGTANMVKSKEKLEKSTEQLQPVSLNVSRPISPSKSDSTIVKPQIKFDFTKDT